MRNRRRIESSGSSWIVIYSDTMALLLCLFVMLFALGRQGGDGNNGARVSEIVGSVRGAFRGEEHSAVIIDEESTSSILNRLRANAAPDASDDGGDDFLSEVLGDDAGESLVIALTTPFAFADGEAQLSLPACSMLDRLAASLMADDMTVRICGRAAPEGASGDASGLRLAHERSWNVADRLIRSGFDPKRVTLESRGSTRVGASTSSDDSPKACIRRVEIVIEKRKLRT